MDSILTTVNNVANAAQLIAFALAVVMAIVAGVCFMAGGKAKEFARSHSIGILIGILVCAAAGTLVTVIKGFFPG